MNIGILGAGVMGCDLAFYLSRYGHKITMIDIEPQKLDQAYIRIKRIGLLAKLHCQIEDYSSIVSSIRIDVDNTLLNSCEIIFECVPENIEIKKAVLAESETICKKNCILITNTSCIAIHTLAEAIIYKERFLGIHFMNPISRIHTVEMVCGVDTSIETEQGIKNFLQGIDKSYVKVGDKTGFVSNRISHLYINEAARIVYEKISSPKDVDTIFRECYKHAMGPLETADLIGIDVVVDSLDILFSQNQEEQYKCHPLLRTMKAEGKLGQKTGEGFHRYY